jgi:hypothetical protein
MASIIRPDTADPSHYRGLGWILEYTNEDGGLRRWNCGQAAAATFLTYHRAVDPVPAAHIMSWLEKHHPPDQLAGWFGTGRRRVERIMRSFNLDLCEVHGTDGIQQQLARHNPVMLMLGTSQGKWLGFNLPGGHWMVAYGCDARQVYLTNGFPMTWQEIEAGWRSLAARWIRMSGVGLAKRL